MSYYKLHLILSEITGLEIRNTLPSTFIFQFQDYTPESKPLIYLRSADFELPDPVGDECHNDALILNSVTNPTMTSDPDQDRDSMTAEDRV